MKSRQWAGALLTLGLLLAFLGLLVGVETTTMPWEAALSYCENLTLGSNTAWRLPNSKELRSLNDETLINPSLDTTYFPGAQATRYWSSTTLAGRTDAAWFTDFTSGLVSYNAKTGLLAVRCVRSS